MKNITKLLSIVALVAAVSYKTAYADLQAVREYQAEQNAGGQRAMAPRERTAPAGSAEFDAKITALKDERQKLNQKIRTANADLASANRKINEIISRIQAQEFDKQLEAAYAWKAKTGDLKWDIGIDLITKSKQAAEQELATAKSQFATLEREKEQLQQQLQKTKTDLKDMLNQKAQQRRLQRQAQPQPQVQEQPRASTAQIPESQRELRYNNQVVQINLKFRALLGNLERAYNGRQITEAAYRRRKAEIEKLWDTQLKDLKD